MSLNNSEERSRLQEVFDQSGIKAEVIELISPGEDPNESIKKNLELLNRCQRLEADNVCDTMVVSGHHDGQFRGELVDGALSPESLLTMSCEYPNIFHGVKSLYLQACNSIDEDVSPRAHGSLDALSDDDERVNAFARDSQNIPGARENPDYQNTNILRQAFFNATTQGWGMIAPSGISKSENSMPIDLLVRAQFEQWLRDEKGVEGSKSIRPSKVASYFNEYIQMHLPNFRYSAKRSESKNSENELNELIQDWNSIVNVDPLQCIWDYYQRKYYYSDDLAGVDQRQAKSLPSANIAELSNFCERENSSEVLQNVQSYLDGEIDRPPENLSSLFNLEENIETNISVLSDILQRSKDKDRVQYIQNKLRKNSKLDEYFNAWESNCVGDCVAQVSIIEHEALKQILTGKEMAISDIAQSCLAFKNIYGDLINSPIEIIQSENYSEDENCRDEVLQNFCSPQYIEESSVKIFQLFYSGEKIERSSPHVIEDYETYLAQVDWCLEKNNDRYQASRLTSVSCRNRSIEKISSKCKRSSLCIAEKLSNSIPNCLREMPEKISYQCHNPSITNSSYVNKQSELAHIFDQLMKSGALDRKSFFFDIKECQNILPSDALERLPAVAKAAIVSIAQDHPESNHIPSAIHQKASEQLRDAKSMDVDYVISSCRELEQRLKKIQVAREKISASDRWGNEELNKLRDELVGSFQVMLSKITKDEWRALSVGRSLTGELGSGSMCIFRNMGEVEYPRSDGLISSTDKTAAECLNRIDNNLPIDNSIGNPINCCDLKFLCQKNMSQLRKKIHPYCVNIFNQNNKEETYDGDDNLSVSATFEVEDGVSTFSHFSSSLCHPLEITRVSSSESIEEDKPDEGAKKKARISRDESPEVVSFELEHSEEPLNSSVSDQTITLESDAVSNHVEEVLLIPKSENIPEEDLPLKCNQDPIYRERFKWKRDCCRNLDTPTNLRDSHCRTSSECISRLNPKSIHENVVSETEVDQLKTERCCFEVDGLRNKYDGLYIEPGGDHFFSSYFRAEFDSMSWLRMKVDWSDAQKNKEMYQMSCGEYFEHNKYYKFFDSQRDPQNFSSKNIRLKIANDKRTMSKEVKSAFWYYPREDKYFINTICSADSLVRLCQRDEYNQSQQKCEENRSCVFIPSRYFK
jgi:hypothetical protein